MCREHPAQTLGLRQVGWWHICPSWVMLHMHSSLPHRAQGVRLASHGCGQPLSHSGCLLPKSGAGCVSTVCTALYSLQNTLPFISHPDPPNITNEIPGPSDRRLSLNSDSSISDCVNLGCLPEAFLCPPFSISKMVIISDTPTSQGI